MDDEATLLAKKTTWDQQIHALRAKQVEHQDQLVQVRRVFFILLWFSLSMGGSPMFF
jgi:hypothetical protein